MIIYTINNTDETRKKISESQLGRLPTQGMTGKKHSQKIRKKMREAALRRWEIQSKT